MSNPKPLFKFVNQENLDEVIYVRDVKSANCLIEVLKSARGQWLLEHEHHEGHGEQHTSKVVVPPPPPKKPKAEPRADGKERRAQKRFSTEFRVVLISGSHSFRTSTHDVSMGGMKLKKGVPHAFTQHPCIIFVSHQSLKENVQINCRVIYDPNDPCRIQFTEASPKQLERLEEWLQESALKGDSKVA